MTDRAIEDAWMSMATGLHIHRHFLEVQSRFEERYARPLRERLQKSIRTAAPGLSERFVSTAPIGMLEHACRQSAASFVDKLAYMPSFVEMAASVGRKSVLIVAEDDCISLGAEHGIIDLSRMPDIATRLNADMHEAVVAVLDVTQFEFLVELNVDVIVHGAKDVDNTGPGMGKGAVLIGSVELNKHLSPTRYAQQLLLAVAAQWLYRFVVSRPLPAECPSASWRSPWHVAPIDTVSFAMSIFAHSVNLAFCERLLDHAPGLLCDGEEDYYSGQIIEERICLEQVQDFVDRLDENLGGPGAEYRHNNMNVVDMVTSFHPGPRQFAGYCSGAGYGQVVR